MSAYSVRAILGGVEAGKTTMMWSPNPAQPRELPPAILLHGAGAPIQWLDVTRAGSLGMGPALAWSGVPAIAAEMGGNTWANDTAMNLIGTAINYLKTQLGITATRVHLVAASMGAGLAVRYAALNPTAVASLTGIIPLASLYNYYASLPAGAAKDEISTAWGVASGAALPAAADLMSLAATLQGVVPSRLYYSSADASINPADQVQLGQNLGSEAVVNVGTAGHTEASIAAALNRGDGLGGEIVNFLLRNA